jgi:protein transport protein SEC61 subunit alpha
MYGKISVLGYGNSALLVLQLFLAGLLVILLDEILSAGYGIITSGASLFIATNVCTEVIWKVRHDTCLYVCS